MGDVTCRGGWSALIITRPKSLVDKVLNITLCTVNYQVITATMCLPLPSHLNVLHCRRSSVSIHPPKGRCAGILRTRSSCRPIQSKVKSLTNAEHICLSERLVWSRLTSDFGHTAEMHTPWISPQESLSCWPFKSAIGTRFFAPARFCGPWKDAGKPTRTQTNRTGIKRARVHMLMCHGGNFHC